MNILERFVLYMAYEEPENSNDVSVISQRQLDKDKKRKKQACSCLRGM